MKKARPLSLRRVPRAPATFLDLAVKPSTDIRSLYPLDTPSPCVPFVQRKIRLVLPALPALTRRLDPTQRAERIAAWLDAREEQLAAKFVRIPDEGIEVRVRDFLDARERRTP